MLLPFETRASVRAVDLDCDRKLPPSALLSMFEQCRWEAWFGAGGVHTGLGLHTLHFVVRAQHLVIGSDVVPGDRLTVDLTLESVGRTSLTFAHRARRVGDGAEVARCNIVAVTMGPEGRPVPVPEVLRATATPTGATFPTPPGWGAEPTEVWSATVHTRRSDLDLLQHVNQARYADLVLDAFSIAAEPHPALAAMRLEYDHEVREHLPLHFVGWPLPGGLHRLIGRVGDQTCVRATLWERGR